MAWLWLILIASGSLRGQDELALTGNVRRNQGAGIGFHCSPEAAAVLFDGSLDDRKSLGVPQDGAVRVTFDQPVLVTRVAVSDYNDPERSYNAARDATVRLWDGERAVGQPVTIDLGGDSELRLGTDSHIVWTGRAEAKMPGDAPVTAVSLEIRKKPGAFQSLVREIEIWGVPAAWAGMRLVPLRATVAENTPSSLRVLWREQLETAKYVRVAYRREGAKAWAAACFTCSPALVLGLSPGARYEVVVEAGTAEGASAAATVQHVRLGGPLEVRTVADVLGMNFYPGGGGAHQAREDETGMTLRMCRLMRDAGVRHVRWWAFCPAGAELFAEYGMSVLPSLPAGVTAEQLSWATGKWGVYVGGTGNEPDFNNLFPTEYVAALKAMRAAADKATGKVLLIGPTFGGELEGPGSDYLDACYRAGMKGMLDALDLHPYVKYATPTPPGGLVGGPEGVLIDLQRAREALRRNGEPNLPITASEAGHPTSEGPCAMPCVTYEEQARRVVRTHLLMVAAGVRRVWWYAFQDEGTDRANAEHCYGLVDWNGKPKPAYEAYRAMIRMVGATVCDGLQIDAKEPVYAVRFRDGRGFVTAVWDSGGESEVRLAVEGGVLAAYDLYGMRIEPGPSRGETCTLKATESVVYLRSARPIRVVSARRLAPPVEPRVKMTLRPSTVPYTPGEKLSWMCRVSSEFDVPVEVELVAGGPWGLPLAKASFLLPAKGTRDEVLGFSAPAAARDRIVSWDVQCRYRRVSTTEEWKWFSRAIFFVLGGY
jgi:hypothetical protein